MRARARSRTAGASPQRALVCGECLAPAALPREVRGHGLTSVRPRFAQALPIAQQLVDALRQALDVARRHEHHAAACRSYLLGPWLATTADRGHPAGHRLYIGDAERLLGRGHHEQGAAVSALDRCGGLKLPKEVDSLCDPQA